MLRSLILVLFVLSSACAEEKLFSGPQVGEKLKPFKVKGVFDDAAGKDLDFVTKADGKPILLLFVHEANRPSIGMARVLMNYAVTRAKDGLHSGTVWLAEDATEAEAKLKQMRHALSKDSPIGISPDGKEGPGAYGLNRNVTLTIILAKDNKVTGNFALVQPSIQADLPKILKGMADVVGGEVPKVEDLPEVKEMAKGRQAEVDPKLTIHLRAMIQRTATPEDVEKAAKEIEKLIKENEAVKKEIARISKTIVEGGKIDNYGTEKAQEYLKKWAKEYGALAPKPKERPKKDGDK